jgi:hypothetical protein
VRGNEQKREHKTYRLKADQGAIAELAILQVPLHSRGDLQLIQKAINSNTHILFQNNINKIK